MPMIIAPERAEDAPDDASPIFDAFVTPNDSLGARGFTYFSIAVVAVACVLALVMFQGFQWIAVGYIAVDGLFLLIAVALFRRSQGRCERVLITNGSVVVVRRDGDRLVDQRRFMIFGLRVETDEDPDFGCLKVCLCQRDRRIEIGRDLSARERALFADGLIRALHVAGGRPRIQRLRRAALNPFNACLVK